ncbi:putative odorant receptor 92a [Trichogramma pretiosum]|uniref:putative odorant receptor 92a n=1 Tax=Trichogramma pretiosum TaxID=7493 RepID=UPI0006C9E0B7|nr:putative odorant receptor 92a [Trichogramma pretiosum]
METLNVKENQKKLDKIARVFQWNRRLMSFLGLWPDSPNLLLFVLTFGYYSYDMFLEYMDLLVYIDRPQNVMLNLMENMAFTEIFVRILMLRVWNRQFGELLAAAEKDFEAKSYDTDEEVAKFVPFYAKAKSFMKLLISNTAFTATSFYVKPLLGQLGPVMDYFGANGEPNSTLIFLLPYRFYVLYELDDAPTYFWTYGSYLPFVFISGFGQSAADCLMVTLVYHLSGQLAVLSMRIEKIDGDAKELRRHVARHAKLLRMGKIIEEAFSAIEFGHLIGATSLVCLLGYQILVCLSIGEYSVLVSLFAFIFLVLLVLYAHCTVGESLIAESNRVCEAYYNCNWIDMRPENARLLILCMARSQKPLRLTAGKFTDLCYQTFTDSIKTSMGYLSVLRAVM